MTARTGLGMLVAVLLAALAAACGSSQRATPVVVDTDLSSDDVIALLYLLENPRVDVRAVAVAGTGLVHCPVGARNAAEVLALAGREDVPVACGSDRPLAGFNAPPEDWRKAADSLFGLELPPAPAPQAGGAVSLLRRHAPGATVLELAPMTNLAGALRSDPGLAREIDAIVAMAGAVSVPGNVDGHEAAETNAWVDPAALRTVLRSGVPVTLVPLDATNHVPVTTYLAEALQRYHYATPSATAAWDLMAWTGMANGGSYFWDPLAAASISDPAVLRTVERRVDVVTRGTDAGRTVLDASGARVALATGARRPLFEQELLGRLLGGAHYAIPPARPAATVTWDGESCSWHGPRGLTAGKLVVETRNRSAQPFEWVVAAIEPPHTLADLKAYVAELTGPPASPPRWLTMQANGSVPPRSEMTWVAWASSGTSGSVVVACALATPPYAVLAATVPVYADRG